MGRYSSCTYFQTLYDAVKSNFPAVSDTDAATILRETILAPDDYELDFNDTVYTKRELLGMFGHTLAQKCITNDKETTHAMILETAADIIEHMNDGYISQDNYSERQEFLEKISRYEFMLFAALAFTKTSEEKDTLLFGELTLNIVRLREIKDLIENYTPDIVDKETTIQDFERAKPIYKMLKSLQNLGYNYNFSVKERVSLGIDHEEDEDLSDKFNFAHWLKRLMLLQLRKEVSAPTTAASTVVNDNKEDEPLSSYDRIARLRGIYNKRRFDIQRFNMIEQTKNASVENTETQN
ncbi:MAG: hypothetical protein IJ778_01080 [Alphaproteobacteria bacterium]|nr:hypothetical protein [Alphaproteobacteria bacterium]